MPSPREWGESRSDGYNRQAGRCGGATSPSSTQPAPNLPTRPIRLIRPIRNVRLMVDRVALLMESELFSGVSEALLREIDAPLGNVSYRAGERIFAQGDLGDAVYVVSRGTLSLEVDGMTLLYRQPGECVGEFALIDDEPRSAAAIALTDVELLRWERRDFQETMSRHGDVARGIFRMLTGKLRQDVESKVSMQLERERWQQDLARAREIQMGMLPAGPLSAPGIEVTGYCQPAAGVGGDYYDFLELPGRRTGLIIGDVTGHGFYSGLFVAMANSCVHTQSGFSYAPAAVMSALRNALDLIHPAPAPHDLLLSSRRADDRDHRLRQCRSPLSLPLSCRISDHRRAPGARSDTWGVAAGPRDGIRGAPTGLVGRRRTGAVL